MKRKTANFKILILALACLLYSCNDHSTTESSSSADSLSAVSEGVNEISTEGANVNSTDFISGDEIPLDSIVANISEKYNPEAIAMHRVHKHGSKIPTIRNELGDGIKLVRKEHKGSTEAGITLPAFGVTLKKDESSLDVFYLEYSIVDDSLVYGIGYSVHYLFKKVKRGISLSNLASIAASAQLNNEKTDVSYSLQTYGISGPIVSKFFKAVVNQDYDVNGYGIIQSSVDGIHGLLSDTTTSKWIKFTPVLFKSIKASDLQN